MSKNDKIFRDGQERRGGQNPKPATPKPDIKPIPLKPSKSEK
jgi:hypothetical protein